MIDFPPGNTGVLHRTESLDNVICLDGELDIDLDDETVHMVTGDVVIQRGTNHVRCNRSSATARVAFVLVDGQPLGIGTPRTTH